MNVNAFGLLLSVANLACIGILSYLGLSYIYTGPILISLLINFLVVVRTDYLHPVFAYCATWLVVSFFAVSEISRYSRPLGNVTASYLVYGIALALAIGSFRPRTDRKPTTRQVLSIPRLELTLSYATLIYLCVTTIEIGVSGYIPLLQGLSGGGTDYLDFGIRSVHGLANAMGCAIFTASVYGYVVSKRRPFLYMAGLIFLCFILLVTRQNIITLTMQSIVIYFLYAGRARIYKIIILACCGLTLFSFAGELRSGDITELAGIKEEYKWIPTPSVWLYAYSYFNVLNFDNTISQPQAPFFDGSSLSTIIPSQFRPQSKSEKIIELSNFNVSGFYTSAATDGGFFEVTFLLVFFLFLTQNLYFSAKTEFTFFKTCTFATLYFCALFAFFVNFWLYLPVVFQIFFFWIFSRSCSYTVPTSPRPNLADGGT